jgi:hypothetical protein
MKAFILMSVHTRKEKKNNFQKLKIDFFLRNSIFHLLCGITMIKVNYVFFLVAIYKWLQKFKILRIY